MLQNLSSVLIRRPDQVDWSTFEAQDWQQFMRAAHAHGVAPLLWYTLEDIGWPDAMPMQVRHVFHMAFYRTAAQNALLYRELEHILGALRGIPVVVLKGAASANTLYPHIGTRPMLDIDLLVPRNAMTESLQALRMLEYHESVPEMVSGFNRVHRYHVCLQKQISASGTLVEIHWQLIGGDTDLRVPPMNWFWDRVEPWCVSVNPREAQSAADACAGDAYQLAPMAHLIYLVAHMMVQHGRLQRRLLWLYDVHLLITRYADMLDWAAMLEHARVFQWDAALCVVLKSTQQYYGTVLPPHVAERVATVPMAAMQDMPMLESPGISRASLLTEELFHLTWRGRYYLLRSHLFPSLAYVRWRYNPRPAWLLPLCYPYRWFDLGREAVCLLGRKLWHGAGG